MCVANPRWWQGRGAKPLDFGERSARYPLDRPDHSLMDSEARSRFECASSFSTVALQTSDRVGSVLASTGTSIEKQSGTPNWLTGISSRWRPPPLGLVPAILFVDSALRNAGQH